MSESDTQKSDPELRDKVLSALQWTVIGRFLAQLFRWGSTIIVIRFLLPADYGLMSMVEVLFGIMMIMAGAGLADGLIRQRLIDDRTERGMLTALIIASLILAALQWFAAPLLASWFDEPEIIILLRVLCVALLLQPWLTLSQAMLRRSMQFRPIAISELIAAVLASIVTLVMAVFGFGVWSLVVGQILNNLTKVVALAIARRQVTLPGKPGPELGELLKFGFFVAMTGILWSFEARVDILIGGRVLDASAIGYYAVAMHLASLAMIKLMPLIHQVGFPGYAQLDGDVVQTRFYLRKTMRLLSLLVAPVFLGLAAVASPLTLIVLGEEWASTAPMLALLCLAMPVRMAVQLYVPGLRALGRADIPMYGTIGSIFIIMACLLLIFRDSAMQMVFAYVVATPLCAAFSHFLADRVFSVGLRGILHDLLPPLVAASVMAVLVFGYVQWGTGMMPLVVLLISAICIGALIYISIGMLFMRERVDEALALVKKR